MQHRACLRKKYTKRNALVCGTLKLKATSDGSRDSGDGRWIRVLGEAGTGVTEETMRVSRMGKLLHVQEKAVQVINWGCVIGGACKRVLKRALLDVQAASGRLGCRILINDSGVSVCTLSTDA